MGEQTAKESPFLLSDRSVDTLRGAPNELGEATFAIGEQAHITIASPSQDPLLLTIAPPQMPDVLLQFQDHGQVFLTIYRDGRCEVAEPWEASAKAFWELVRELGPQYFPSRTPSSGSGLDAAA